MRFKKKGPRRERPIKGNGRMCREGTMAVFSDHKGLIEREVSFELCSQLSTRGGN